MYTPGPMDANAFFVSPETQARTARAERLLVRMEEKAASGCVAAALRRSLARLEAASTIRIEGKAPRLRVVLFLESLSDDDEDAAAVADAVGSYDFASDEEREAAFAVLYFERALDLVYRSADAGEPFTPAQLLEIHALAQHGTSAASANVRFREQPFAFDQASPAAHVYEPPPPEAVVPLVEDLAAFINRDVFAPITQSAIAHFQFEGIKPFKSGMDKTGRLMCHAIIRRRGLMRQIIAPIGLEPAIDTESHAHSLLPYNFGRVIDESNRMAFIDQWAAFCAWSAEVSVKAADVYLDAMLALRDSWLDDFGRPNRGSAAAALLDLLPGMPVLTVKRAAKMTGKSVSSVNEAFLRLEDAGIVRTDERSQRARLFVAQRAVDLFEDLERAITPAAPVNRDALA